jgi:uncharacterized protein
MSLVKLVIEGISYSQTQNGAYALILNEADGDRKLPIVIGAFEAQSIAITLEKEITPPRPLTHDLFKNFAERFDIKIKQVIIHKLVDGVFYSSIICERDGIEEIIDARTSDAIALALRFEAAIFTYRAILDKAGIVFRSKNEPITDKEEEEIEEEVTEENNTNVNDDDSLLENLLENSKKTSNKEFEHVSLEDLYTLLDTAIKDEDYERAAYIRDEINNREA